MPKQDKTGPEGKGPKTGRGLGNCKKTPICDAKIEEVDKDDDVFGLGRGGKPRHQNGGPGRGRGNGRGMGRNQRSKDTD